MDASYKIQRGIHVHLIQFFMCPEFWVHITANGSGPAFWVAQLLGSPTEPNAVGRLGRGGARERREGCPRMGVPTGADFATTRAAGIRTLWHCGGGKPPPYR